MSLLLALVQLFVIAPGTTLPEAPEAVWKRLANQVRSAGFRRVPEVPAIRIGAAPQARGHAGRSAPGLVELRPGGEALAHELAHQLLFAICPGASADELFHEAFAMAAAVEQFTWSEGPYLGVPLAVQVLHERSLDSRAARRALARLLLESGGNHRGLPPSIRRRLLACSAGAAWTASSPEELAEGDVGVLAEASLVLNRHSGEVLLAEGEVRRPLPFGSVMKPFVVAAAASTPVLAPRPEQREWACGESLPAAVGAELALLRSCNGWFLDWARREPRDAPFGAYGPVLLKLGLSRLPGSMAEAIGLVPALSISPWAIAQAYRALAEARPDLVAALARNAREGTLAGLPESAALEGVALKTGTVRDASSRPRVGFIVAITSEVIAVRVHGGRMPRAFAGELVALLRRASALPGARAAQVQVFGLLPESAPEIRCEGVGLSLTKSGPLLVEGYQALQALTSAGPALCLAQPWRARFAGGPAEGRPYAGIFTLSPPSAAERAPGTPRTDRERRARRGSDFVFRTALSSYAAGVVQSEAAHLKGQPRAALLRVAAHDEAESRHPGRPVCDTTHCQVFQGTAPLQPGDADALARPPLPWRGFLSYSAGGTEPWTAQRALADVEAALGAGFSALRFEQGKAWYTLPHDDGAGPYEAAHSVPCEALRAALRLPACPSDAALEDGSMHFSGKGQGHGQGLDVDAAAKSGLDQEELLRRAYGRVGETG